MESARLDTEIETEGQGMDRRRHRRLAIRLPVECWLRGRGREGTLRAVTANISTGGVYFEAELVNGHRELLSENSPVEEDLLELELTIPPGEGHFPYERQVRSVVQIVRRDDMPAEGGRGGQGRIGLAGRFNEPLKFGF
jgi:hypothetical protein